MMTDEKTDSPSTRTPGGGRPRPVVRVGIATAVLACTVVGGIGFASSASAATSETDATTRVVDAVSWRMAPGDFGLMGKRVCPASAPFLVDQNLSPGRLVPRGVEVIESGFGIGVHIPYTATYGPGMTAHGFEGGNATNWDLFGEQSLLIRLHCTSDEAASYTVPVDDRYTP